ncbi:MAG TPA: response regulator [Candidatus Sulfotelmatobacter sp.]|nr:response regulator [Candidatus Sulfotelmatobacter sp.]
MEGDTTQSAEPSSNLAFHSESAASLVLLYVEDSPDDQTLFQEALTQSGLPVECVPLNSAANAIAYLERLLQQRSVGPTRWPDLVLLDWTLPGQSGITVLQYLRGSAAWQRLPVIVFSGNPNPQQTDEAYRLGANSCLCKPLRFDRMVEITRAIYQAWTLALRPRPPAAAP